VQAGPLPEPGGLDGLVQDGALALLDDAVCHLGSSREELALALVDKRQHAPTRTSTELIHVRRATYFRGFSMRRRHPWGLFDRLLGP
jgi:hypothetical protein